MTDRIGRNNLCPCGSGKKFKKCCMHNSQQEETKQRISPRFRFEPGTYGDVGSFVPSIACLKQIAPNKWDNHFVLVRPDKLHYEEETAASQAEKDLDMAFLQKQQSGSDFAVAEYLRAKGYVSVTDFKVVKERKDTSLQN